MLILLVAYSISLGTAAARLIRDAKLIAWDEAPMLNSKCYELVDAAFRDIMGQVDPMLEKLPFGGKVVIFGGDMRKTLHVVKKGSRAMIVDSCINRSPFWPDVQCLKLTINMRATLLQGMALTCKYK